MKYLSGLITILMGCFLLVGQAYAVTPLKTPTVYASASVGYGYIDYRLRNNLENKFSLNRGGLVWGGTFGVLVIPNLGIETSYLNFDNNVSLVSNGGTFLDHNHLITLALKGIWNPVDYFSLFGKAGVAQSSIHYTQRAKLLVMAPDATVSKYVPYFAVGISQNITKRLAASFTAHAALGSKESFNFDLATQNNQTPGFYGATLDLMFTL